jgi:hypothetical protein
MHRDSGFASPAISPFRSRQPLIEYDAADSCVAERYERVLFDAAAEVPRTPIRHHSASPTEFR